MREIKFRVFDNHTKTMHVCGEDSHDSIVFFDNQACYYNLQNGEGSLKDDEGDSTYELMQYTGLKDKNGTEIYEGDITTSELHEEEGLAFEVYYDNEKGMFKQRPFMFKDNGKKLGNKDLTLQMDLVENKEVIGNIYENPELLEVGA